MKGSIDDFVIGDAGTITITDFKRDETHPPFTGDGKTYPFIHVKYIQDRGGKTYDLLPVAGQPFSELAEAIVKELDELVGKMGGLIAPGVSCSHRPKPKGAIPIAGITEGFTVDGVVKVKPGYYGIPPTSEDFPYAVINRITFDRGLGVRYLPNK